MDHRSPKKELSPDAANPTIVLHLPGFRLAMLASVCESFWRLASTLGTAAALLIAAYVAYTLAWNVVSLWASILVDASVSVLLGFSTFMSCIMLSMDAKPKATPVRYHYVPKPAAVVIEEDEVEEKAAAPAYVKLPSLSPEGSIVSQPTQTEKTDDAAFAKERELQVPVARRRILSHLKQSHPVVNVVAGETRRRAQMSLQDASIRVGKAYTQKAPGSRKPQDIYVVRVDCGARTAAQEKHMNPVIMWDLTATFEEFQKLERELKKEVKAKKLTSEAKVPHLSSGAVLFVQEELTDHVLNARRLRLQNFIETVRSNPVLANTTSMRKFCQAY
ncbi:hypothetical protein BBJ28_00019074 [Nothophytophthora sp. Chile5]|nr:hypothetical protein BBJ28_00019074 [Nothophytophthora sp. Chile5]